MRIIRWMLIAAMLVVLGEKFAYGASYELRDRAGNVVVLLDAPCEQGGWLAGWRRATLHYDGKDYAACWVAMGEMVMVLDSSGDVTPVPRAAFRRLQEG